MRLAIESLILVIIGVLDLASTLFLVRHHGAQEANPLFKHYLEMGPIWFSIAKGVMILGPIALLEWARRTRPRFTKFASRFAICAYVAMYVVGVARLNPGLVHGQSMSAAYINISGEEQLVSIDELGAERDAEGAVTYLPPDPLATRLIRHSRSAHR